MAAEQIVLITAPQWWEITAALATAISAGVIAWQAFLTRKSVAASEKAVTVAQASLVESQIARIETGAPRLSVKQRNWPNPDEATVRFERGGETRTVNDTDIFKLPRDGKVELTIAIDVEMRNDGPDAAVMKLEAVTGRVSAGYPIELTPGQVFAASIDFTLTVAEWIALIDEVGKDGKRAAKKAGAITATYRGPRDADLDEVHVMDVHGSLLLAVEDAQGDWRPHHHPFELQTFKLTAPVVTRTYWRSRQANQKFELVELD